MALIFGVTSNENGKFFWMDLLNLEKRPAELFSITPKFNHVIPLKSKGGDVYLIFYFVSNKYKVRILTVQNEPSRTIIEDKDSLKSMIVLKNAISQTCSISHKNQNRIAVYSKQKNKGEIQIFELTGKKSTQEENGRIEYSLDYLTGITEKKEIQAIEFLSPQEIVFINDIGELFYWDLQTTTPQKIHKNTNYKNSLITRGANGWLAITDSQQLKMVRIKNGRYEEGNINEQFTLQQPLENLISTPDGLFAVGYNKTRNHVFVWRFSQTYMDSVADI